MRPFAAVLVLSLVGCRSVGSGANADYRIVATETNATVSVDEVVDDLQRYDVVFLGEKHDSSVGHRLQLEITRGLLARRPELALSLEMFERDVQELLDRYLFGFLDEEHFLADARPWKNYREAYRPAVELMREHRLPVLAANAPRPLASRVVEDGPTDVLTEPFAPRQVHAAAGEYRRRFVEVMGERGQELPAKEVDRIFASQCIKDDTMAETIADFLADCARPRPQIVHWCGSFHSDRRLGTVERLLRRAPYLKVAVVSMVQVDDIAAELTSEGRELGRYVLLVEN